jgi:uncharacterized damage-inducible protein DinB
MTILEALTMELNSEIAGVRKTLERVPMDNLDWRPHPKSMTMGELASHLANIPSWTAMTFSSDSLDIQPPGAPPYEPHVCTTREQLLADFDQNVESARQALASASEESLAQNWSLLKGGQPVLTVPRFGVLRNFILSHMVHHRAQLGVYLRMNDIPVPSIYGPSADESGM